MEWNIHESPQGSGKQHKNPKSPLSNCDSNLTQLRCGILIFALAAPLIQTCSYPTVPSHQAPIQNAKPHPCSCTSPPNPLATSRMSGAGSPTTISTSPPMETHGLPFIPPAAFSSNLNAPPGSTGPHRSTTFYTNTNSLAPRTSISATCRPKLHTSNPPPVRTNLSPSALSPKTPPFPTALRRIHRATKAGPCAFSNRPMFLSTAQECTPSLAKTTTKPALPGRIAKRGLSRRLTPRGYGYIISLPRAQRKSSVRRGLLTSTAIPPDIQFLLPHRVITQVLIAGVTRAIRFHQFFKKKAARRMYCSILPLSRYLSYRYTSSKVEIVDLLLWLLCIFCKAEHLCLLSFCSCQFF